MINRRFIHSALILIISAFIYNCGGRYEPQVVPKDNEGTDLTSRERHIVETGRDITPVATIKRDKVSESKFTRNVSKYFFQRGIASWYGVKFHGRRTSNGEVYDKYKLTAAHKTLPFNTIVEVLNIENHKKVIVRINDRGPFVKNRIIDLSKKAASMLGIEDTGTAPVILTLLNNKHLNKLSNSNIILKSSQQTKLDNVQHRTRNYTVKSEQTQWFYIQAGAFRDRINAEKLLNKIRRVTDTVFSIQIIDEYYKVISVKFPSRRAAEKISINLKRYYIDTFVKSF
jgi:rare lipoprotein A